MSQKLGCEICGCPRVVWRGGAHVCSVCSALYDQWAAGMGEPRPGLPRFIAEAASATAGGPLEAAKARHAARESEVRS